MAEDDEILDDEEEEGEYNIPAIIIAVVIALVLIGSGVWYFFLRESPSEEDEQDKVVWEAPAEGFQEEDISDFFPQMLINPLDSRGRYFLILKLNISLNDMDKVKYEIFRKPWRLAQAQNTIYDICSGYRIEELRTPKVREEIRLRIKEGLNEMLGWFEEQAKEEAAKTGEEMTPPPIADIYFEEYILQ